MWKSYLTWLAVVRFTPQNASDTLIVAQRLVSLISEKGKLGSALSILKNEMVGSYCFTFLSDDFICFAARDPKGFRPLVIGKKKMVGHI